MKKKLLFASLLIISTIITTACSSSGAKIGDQVSIYFTATFPDGVLFQSNSGTNQPLNFKIGSGSQIAGIEDAVIGMKKGESKTFTVNPDQGFGKNYDKTKTQKIAMVIFTVTGKSPKIGQTESFGQQQVLIKDIEGTGEDAKVVVDFNPPETYQNLKYTIYLQDISNK